MQFDMMRTMDNGAWPNRRLCFIQFKHCGCYSTVAKVAIKSFCFHANSCMHTYEMGNLFLLWMQLMKLDKIPSSTLTSSAMDVLSLSNLQIKFQFNCPPFYKHKRTFIHVIGFQIVLFAFFPAPPSPHTPFECQRMILLFVPKIDFIAMHRYMYVWTDGKIKTQTFHTVDKFKWISVWIILKLHSQNTVHRSNSPQTQHLMPKMPTMLEFTDWFFASKNIKSKIKQ